ncbi:MAG TPA: MOSC domain-containing protein [Verrucomicrobiae bacterium]|jgi:MOSC domain-containing protein YiiM|nr:MOSC domain-containing protein [Verrucomicrobiae bacterium]
MQKILDSPKNDGVLELIACRPKAGERETLETAELHLAEGVVGDNWKMRGAADKTANPDMQVTVMNSRVIALLADDKAHWPLAGDQLYVDFDLSIENLPPGSKVGIGSAILQISPQPHTGCKKFLARFGQDALEFVNSAIGKQLRLRGLNARIVQPGIIRVGDKVRKLTSEKNTQMPNDEILK